MVYGVDIFPAKIKRLTFSFFPLFFLRASSKATNDQGEETKTDMNQFGEEMTGYELG